jgi:hypothetical protein
MGVSALPRKPGSDSLFGGARPEGIASGEALVRLYTAVRFRTKLFQPSFELKQKTPRWRSGLQAITLR